MVEGALMVALAQILSFIKLWEMPWGGSVILSMVPLVLYGLRWGPGSGFTAACVFGVMQFLFDGGFAIGWQSIIGDYVLAYGALGIAGIFRGRRGGIYLGTLSAGALRFLVHYVVGATVWAEYMPEIFLGLKMSTPWFYSLLYNGVYMLLNTAVTLAAFALLSATPVKKYLYGADITR